MVVVDPSGTVMLAGVTVPPTPAEADTVCDFGPPPPPQDAIARNTKTRGQCRALMRLFLILKYLIFYLTPTD
jgi:hypothetical protein